MPKNQKRLHIIGAGLAGLTAAIYASDNYEIHLHESSPQTGGRCRSFKDSQLGAIIDNGNHLLLGANHHAIQLIDLLGIREHFLLWDNPLPFIDLVTNQRWHIKCHRNLSVPAIPDIHFWQFFRSIWDLAKADHEATITSCLTRYPTLYQRFWEPLAVSILNTPGNTASATMLKPIIKQLACNRNALHCYLPKTCWQEALINPATNHIIQHGGTLHTQHRIQKLDNKDCRITALILPNTIIPVREQDQVILATPPSVTRQLLPDIPVPTSFSSIVNIHFHYHHDTAFPMIGIIGGAAHWVFIRDGIISTTTSAAESLVSLNEANIAEAIWQDIQQVMNISDPLPPYRVIKEKRASFACTIENEALRPDIPTDYKNLWLAGDYTNTGLPATIEGAVYSGKKAVSTLPG